MRVYWTLCGSDGNNAYLIVCPETAESIIVDAPLNPEAIIEQTKGTHVRAILITHRHSDHLEGLDQVVEATGAPVAAHADDADEMPSRPDILLADGDTIRAGSVEVKAIHVPGHTPAPRATLPAITSSRAIRSTRAGRARPAALRQLCRYSRASRASCSFCRRALSCCRATVRARTSPQRAGYTGTG